MLFRLFVVAAIAVISVGVGFIAYRDFRNSNQCREKYGNNSTWIGQDRCTVEKKL